MNIVKFIDVIITPENLVGLEGNEYEVRKEGTSYKWVKDNPAYYVMIPGDSTRYPRTPEMFCEFFNNCLRNRYAYAIWWKSIMLMYSTKMVLRDPEKEPTGIESYMEVPDYDHPYTAGNPWEPNGEIGETGDIRPTYVSAEMDNLKPFLWDFNAMDAIEAMKNGIPTSIIDKSTVIDILNNNWNKYNYLNKFTPDDDITIEELKQFRSWLAEILLQNKYFIDNWPDSDKLILMLTYYKQNMMDSTTDALLEFGRYMTSNVLVAGVGLQSVFNMAMIGRSAGCGCNGSLQGVGAVAAAGGCDPVQMYRNAIYNYMVETFSTLEYWDDPDQKDICKEMRKYIEGILKVGLPLGSKIIDPYADCGCNTFDSDSQTRYRKMLEALVQALTYIIDGNIAGNRNYIITAFSNWATYLYEYMYWA